MDRQRAACEYRHGERFLERVLHLLQHCVWRSTLEVGRFHLSPAPKPK
jgi:hypothetical protein